MSVQLEAIAFNHDPTSADSDALNLRRNETRTIPVPEWRRGGSADPAASVAAYAIAPTRARRITISVTLSRLDPNLTSAEVRAITPALSEPPPWWLARSLGSYWPYWRTMAPGLADVWRRSTAAGNVLGEVRSRRVEFPTQGTVVVPFDLDGYRVAASGVGADDVRWRWQWRRGSAHPWTDLTDSLHRIYSVLDVPTEPWQQQPVERNANLPWSEVLEHACAWARGARTADNAAAGITAAVYALGGELIAYDCPGHGFTHYTNFGRGDGFDCTAFLNRLAGGFGRGYWVNCVDCATIVSTFANAIGCDLWQSAMFSPAQPFALNRSIAIGFDPTRWQTPCNWPTFGYHEVAWKGRCTADDVVFDACLQVDGFGDPTSEPRFPVLPANLRFGRPGQGTYVDRLAAPAGRFLCQPQPALTRRRRPLRWLSPESGRAGEVPVAVLRSRADVAEWRGRERLADRLFVWQFLVTGQELPDWQPFRVHYDDDAAARRRAGLGSVDGPPTALAVARSYWRPAVPAEAEALDLDVHECASVEAAHDLLANMLGVIEAPLTRRDDLGLGDVAFAGPRDTAVLFARANLVVLLRNAEPRTVAVEQLAHAVDAHITERPTGRSGTVPAARRSRATANRLNVGASMPLGISLTRTAPERTMIKVFSGRGQVSVQGDEPRYRADRPGTDDVEVYAVRPDGSARQRTLRIGVQR